MQISELSPASRVMHGVIGRDIVTEMASYMRAYPGCTVENLRGEGFTIRQIERYGADAAAMAGRLSIRRLA